jgi:hypothetical protein
MAHSAEKAHDSHQMRRIGNKVLQEVLEEDDYLLKHRHERMIAAELRSWANKLMLGRDTQYEGEPLFFGGKRLVYTQDGVRAAFQRGESKLLSIKADALGAATAAAMREAFKDRQGGASAVAEEQCIISMAKVPEAKPARGSRIFRLIHECANGSISGEWLYSLANLIHASHPAFATTPPARIPNMSITRIYTKKPKKQEASTAVENDE